MPGRFDITPTLAKIWHAPDHIRIMDPLPPMHRRGIIAGALLVIIGILLPSEESSSRYKVAAKPISTCNRSPSRNLPNRPCRCHRLPLRRR